MDVILDNFWAKLLLNVLLSLLIVITIAPISIKCFKLTKTTWKVIGFVLIVISLAVSTVHSDIVLDNLLYDSLQWGIFGIGLYFINVKKSNIK
ncbi:hypothetical protein [Photobacterium aquimaris]|nr:hypothetical protein [Photobacterium aquimaris]MCP4955200.1 hypothetical protein [Photobacterium aquimaris]